jgi:hypothetical protein
VYSSSSFLKEQRMFRVTSCLAILLAVSCSDSNDLNRTCKFAVNPDGGFVSEKTARELTLKNKDFVGLGATDCESKVCVRDSKYVPRGDIKDTDRAEGYCTAQCELGQACQSETRALDESPDTKLSCRSLLLSADVLADPAVRNLVGGLTTSFFCARGQTPDSGM